MIEVYQRIAGGLWIVTSLYWVVAAFGAKPNIAKRPWWLRIPVRLAIVAALFYLVYRPFGGVLRAPGAALLGSNAAALAGLAVTATGLGVALWARMVIGRNWGTPMTLKEGHELVTGGPYANVRHPIYSGILLAMVGSALTISLWFVVFFVLNGVQFVYAARREERLMLSTFPDSYPAYRARTRMLIPFVF